MNHTSHRSNSVEDCSGAVLMELAFVLPVLLLISLGMFELSSALERFQMLSTATREAGNWGLRNCAGLDGNLTAVDGGDSSNVRAPARPTDPTPIETCLIEVVDSLKTEMSQDGLPFELTISVLALDADGVTLNRKGMISSIPYDPGTKSGPPPSLINFGGGSPHQASYYTDSRIEDELRDQLEETNTVVIAEAFSPITKPYAKILLSLTSFYEATIF